MATALQPTDLPSPPIITRSMIAEVFAAAISRLVFGWTLLFALISAATYSVAPETFVASTLIALASGIVAVVALLPGANLLPGAKLADSATPSPSDATLLVTSIFAAMAIRVTGTVALFLLCRYQLGHPPQTIAFFVCGWYVLLTTFEVILLVQSSKSLTSKNLTSKKLSAKALTQGTESI